MKEKIAQVRAKAAEHGRTVRFGIRLHVIVRETNDEARQAADRLIAHLDDDTIAKAQAAFAKTDSVGQHRMASLHNGKRENLEISPNLWAGVGLVRGGAGTALVGDGPTVAARINEYAALGIDSFILSGYPHLEEAYKVGELLFPHRCRYPGNSAATSASVAGRSRGERVYPEKSRAKLRSHHVCNRTKMAAARRAVVSARRHCPRLATGVFNWLAVEPHFALSGGRCGSVLVAKRQR